MKINDYVLRKSHNMDILFIITDIKDNIAYLKGLYIRIYADSNIDDLVYAKVEDIDNLNKKYDRISNGIIDLYSNKIKHITGKILHIDSDSFYILKCMNLYNKLNIKAEGICVAEEDISKIIIEEIEEFNPNIVVITGHDSFNNKDINNINNYKNSKYYINTVKKIRSKYSLNDIFIFAGACGSYFDLLIESGANFASSIKRDNIELYDPAIVAINAAITPFNNIINNKEINDIFKGFKNSIGGIESFGCLRLLL